MPPINFNKRVLFVGFSSGFNNKVKQVKWQKMRLISAHSESVQAIVGGEGIPALSLLDEWLSSWARSSVQSLRTSSSLKCTLAMSSYNTKAATASCLTIITHGYSPYIVIPEGYTRLYSCIYVFIYIRIIIID